MCLLTCKDQPEGCSLPRYAQNPGAPLSRICAAFLDENQEMKRSMGPLHAHGIGNILGNRLRSCSPNQARPPQPALSVLRDPPPQRDATAVPETLCYTWLPAAPGHTASSQSEGHASAGRWSSGESPAKTKWTRLHPTPPGCTRGLPPRPSSYLTDVVMDAPMGHHLEGMQSHLQCPGTFWSCSVQGPVREEEIQVH